METEIYFLASNSGCKCHCQQFHSFHRWNEADIILFTKVLQYYYYYPQNFLCNSAFYCHWSDQSQSARRSKPKVKHILFSSIMYFGCIFSCATNKRLSFLKFYAKTYFMTIIHLNRRKCQLFFGDFILCIACTLCISKSILFYSTHNEKLMKE